MNTRQAGRAANMAYLKQFLYSSINQRGEIDYEKVIAYLVVTLCLSRRTAKEMVDSYILYGDFQLIGNVICYSKKGELKNPLDLTYEDKQVDSILSAIPIDEGQKQSTGGEQPLRPANEGENGN